MCNLGNVFKCIKWFVLPRLPAPMHSHYNADASPFVLTWWRHQMEIYSALLAICAGNSPMNSPHKRPVMRSLDVFFNLRLIKRLNKQSWGRSRPLWRHCNDVPILLLSTQAPSSSPRSLQYRCFSWGNPRTLPDDTHETCSGKQTTPSFSTREPHLWKGFHPWLGRLHWSRRGLWDTREPLLFATCYYTLGSVQIDGLVQERRNSSAFSSLFLNENTVHGSQ